MKKHTHQPIIEDSIREIGTDPKIVRITFLTTFFHSLVVIMLIILNLNKLFVQNMESGSQLSRIPQFLVSSINDNNIVPIFIVSMIILFVLYSIIYPIGQAAVIHYLHHRKGMRDSLRASLKFFYPMFEFGFISALFSAVPFFWIAFKVFILNGSRSIWMILLFLLWMFVFTNVNKFKVYTRYFIVIHKLPLYDALRNSILLTKKAKKTTSKYMSMQGWLLVNFSINVALLVGIPLLVIHVAILLDAISFWYVKGFVYFLFALLIFASAYMSSFIRAFFAYYRYDAFMKTSIHKSL